MKFAGEEPDKEVADTSGQDDGPAGRRGETGKARLIGYVHVIDGGVVLGFVYGSGSEGRSGMKCSMEDLCIRSHLEDVCSKVCAVRSVQCSCTFG